MKRNMGTLDRLLRTVIAAPALITLALLVFEPGSVLSVVAVVLAGVMVATSAAGFCPLYVPLGISTDAPATTGRGRIRAATEQ